MVGWSITTSTSPLSPALTLGFPFFFLRVSEKPLKFPSKEINFLIQVDLSDSPPEPQPFGERYEAPILQGNFSVVHFLSLGQTGLLFSPPLPFCCPHPTSRGTDGSTSDVLCPHEGRPRSDASPCPLGASELFPGLWTRAFITYSHLVFMYP